MSRPQRRSGAFSSGNIAELSDLLPTIPAPGTAKPAETPKDVPPPVVEQPPAAVPLASVPAVAENKATRPTGRVRAPEVAIAPEVYRALRELTMKERTTNPSTSRTYGQIVLDAIEENASVLAKHWRVARRPKATALFQRTAGEAPTRRRHSEAPARVPLAGIVASDAEQMDNLAAEWGAGSRSALAEQALRIYLQVQ